MMEKLKYILIAFAKLSGLKINFSKSELIPLNIEESFGVFLANILGCKVITLPITYLGIPLH